MRLPSLALVPALLTAQIQFKDATVEAGLRFELRNGASGGFHQIELMPGGVAALDFNRDGCMDIFFTNGAASPSLDKRQPEFHNRLFRNNCNGTFTDVTAQAALEGEGYSMAAAVADYDNDGFPDIFVAGVDRNVLYHNLGNGKFEDMTRKAGLAGVDPKYGKMWSISAGWFDADNDGWLDLFVSNYVAWDPRTEPKCGAPESRLYCHPDAYSGRPNHLFLNNHDGTFRDASESSGIARSLGKGMGVSFADYDRDGLMDVFVANDSVQNLMFHNDGHGKFHEVGLEVGVSLGESGRPIAGMGTDFRDYNNDGFPDVSLTGMINDAYLLFRNSGGPYFFEDYTIKSGLAKATRQLTGWGMGLFDFDNDGWKDLFFANSHFPNLGKLLSSSDILPCAVLKNMGNGRFQDVSADAGAAIRTAASYRGVAFADFDGDGRVDAVVTALNSSARLFLNVTPRSGHWLAVKLIGTRTNRDGIGTEIQAILSGGVNLYNHATTSVGYASSSETLVRFGLGARQHVQELRITWPSGHTDVLKDVAGDHILEVHEK